MAGFDFVIEHCFASLDDFRAGLLRAGAVTVRVADARRDSLLHQEQRVKSGCGLIRSPFCASN